MKPRYVDTNLCVHWKNSRCVESAKCPFGYKRIDAHGVQRCDMHGQITDNPKFDTNEANRAYDEMKKREEAMRG